MISRIKELIDYLKMSNRAFALKCGLKDNTFFNQLNGNRELSLSTVSSILQTFDFVSSEWLMRGSGSMLKSDISSTDDIEKMDRLVDTITTLQSALNEKSKTVQALEQEVLRLSKKE